MRQELEGDELPIVQQFLTVMRELCPNSTPTFRCVDETKEEFTFDLGIPGLACPPASFSKDLIEESIGESGRKSQLKDLIKAKVARCRSQASR
jgi:hypothetical protein